MNKEKIEISFRLLNIKLDTPFSLEENIKFTPLTKEVILSKYPFDRWFSVPAQLLKTTDWYQEHNAEVTFTLDKEKYEYCQKIESRDSLEGIIRDTFTFADISDTKIYASHSYGPGQQTFIQGISDIKFQPILITQEHVCNLQNIYSMILKIKEDPILNLVFDRFILAKNRQTDHPHKINKANWDKIIDYITAFETLLLSGKEELSYRFRLNGTSLISKIDNKEKRIIFNALKILYELRSKIVHGGNEKEIKKLANKLIEALSLGKEDHSHDIGLLILISKQLNTWLILIFEFLSILETEKRPHNNTQVWEDWLWKDTANDKY